MAVNNAGSLNSLKKTTIDSYKNYLHPSADFSFALGKYMILRLTVLE